MPLNKAEEYNLWTIGATIRHHRESKGYSQESFAVTANIHRSYYGRIERGEQNISISVLIKIAFALELELGNLLPSLDVLMNPFDPEHD